MWHVSWADCQEPLRLLYIDVYALTQKKSHIKYILNCIWTVNTDTAVSNSSVYFRETCYSHDMNAFLTYLFWLISQEKSFCSSVIFMTSSFSPVEENIRDFIGHHFWNGIQNTVLSHQDILGIVCMKFSAVTEWTCSYVCYIVHVPSRHNHIIIWKEKLLSQESGL